MAEGSASSWAIDLVSSRTGATASLQHSQLPLVEAPWLVRYELDRERGEQLRRRLEGRPWTLWRYRELLPVQGEASVADLGEGGTPLIRLRRLFAEFPRILLKDESGNPTGSFKARGLSVAVNRARELGATAVQLPSAGNAALAAAAYAAAAGLRCRIALPIDTPSTISRICRAYGSEVLCEGHTLVESGARLAEQSGNYWDLATFKEPYRVEGKKTMGFEIAEQLGWRLPDWIVYPTGGGTGIVALAKAFDELRQLGWIGDDKCRLVSVQMEGCAPVVDAFHRGATTVDPWTNPQTEVWGLRVPRSLADVLILEALRHSEGEALTVAEAAVRPMQARLAREEGLLVGPEGAAAVLGVEELIRQGRVDPGDTVVVFQTGHPANYSDTSALADDGKSEIIDAGVEA